MTVRISLQPIGVLLTNTGSPAAPTPAALRPYLAQFLSDPRIIELPGWLWLPVLHGILLNMRPQRSARLYQRIWTHEGSPLLLTAQRQSDGLRRGLRAYGAADIRVAIGMRYGRPSIAEALCELRDAGVKRILVFPLFPHYSATTTASALDAVFDEIKTWRWLPELRTITHYHDHPGYIESLVASVREGWQAHSKPDRLLFSFHGIPKRYALAGDPYPDQCRRTAQLVVERLGLKEGEWEIAFQSRFGPVEWLKPYTDELLEEWGRQKMRKVHVICPGFSADCLETIDEIARECRHTFAEAGGGDFHYIPALNDRADHITMLTNVALDNLQGWLGAGDPDGL